MLNEKKAAVDSARQVEEELARVQKQLDDLKVKHEESERSLKEALEDAEFATRERQRIENRMIEEVNARKKAEAETEEKSREVERLTEQVQALKTTGEPGDESAATETATDADTEPKTEEEPERELEQTRRVPQERDASRRQNRGEDGADEQIELVDRRPDDRRRQQHRNAPQDGMARLPAGSEPDPAPRERE